MTRLGRWLALVGVAFALAASAQTPAAPDQAVTLVFAGDTTLDDDAGALIERGGDPLADFASLFAQADVRLANLECVVATGGSAGRKNYTFRAHPRVLPVLKKHLDGVTLANNHSGDFGREAFAEMLGLLQRAGLAQAGGGLNLSQAHAPWILERRGLRIVPGYWLALLSDVALARGATVVSGGDAAMVATTTDQPQQQPALNVFDVAAKKETNLGHANGFEISADGKKN